MPHDLLLNYRVQNSLPKNSAEGLNQNQYKNFNVKKAVESAKQLIERTKQSVEDPVSQRDFIELIKTIIIYKLPKKSREELEAMLGLSELKQTKVYQEAKAEGKAEGKVEGKVEAVPRLLKLGLTEKQIGVRSTTVEFYMNYENICYK